MRPAWDGDNLFCSLLADALIERGLSVHELGFGAAALPLRPGIAFFHWPNEMFFVSKLRSVRTVAALLAKIALAKHRHGLKVVWLAHNIVPHDRSGWRLLPAQAAFLRLLDGVIFLSDSSRAAVLAAYPKLARTAQLTIAHGLYPDQERPAVPPPAVASRPVRLACAGRVKRYKAPHLLAQAVAAMPEGEADLLIAGACDDPDLARTLTNVASSCAGVRLHLAFLSDGEMERKIDEADAIVIPYRDILNSGSAIHALSRFRPFIAPRLGSLSELQEQVGPDWIWLYDGDLTPEVLADAVRWVRETPRPDAPDLSHFQWPMIADRLAAFLRRIA